MVMLKGGVVLLVSLEKFRVIETGILGRCFFPDGLIVRFCKVVFLCGANLADEQEKDESWKGFFHIKVVLKGYELLHVMF
jgi:hypothetical protein